MDGHHHVSSAFRVLGGKLSSAPGGAREEDLHAEVAARLAVMDDEWVDLAVGISGHGYERPNGIADTRAQNDAIAAYRDAHSKRFPAAIGIVEPRDGEVNLDELARACAELEVVGISFHTRFQVVSLDSR